MKKKLKIDHVKFLETNDVNWYKLCINKINYKQLSVDDVKKDKAEQIKFKIWGGDYGRKNN